MAGVILFRSLGATPFVLALLYAAALTCALVRTSSLTRRKASLDTTKLFVMSIGLSCFCRVMGFCTIGALNLQSVRVGYHGIDTSNAGLEGRDSDQNFYEEAILIMFDFPDFIMISAYALLGLVWAEQFLRSRRHWLRQDQFRRRWLVAYLVFNAVLYTGQVILYGLLLFLPRAEKDLLVSFIYILITTANFFLPTALASLWLYLAISFSGFPSQGKQAEWRLQRVSKVVLSWTLTRLIWGTFALLTALQPPWLLDFISGSNAIGGELYAVFIMMLFIVTELGPFAAALD
ncbi:unnamed protein product, partial [Chrysoparadoxa australica]